MTDKLIFRKTSRTWWTVEKNAEFICTGTLPFCLRAIKRLDKESQD